MVRIANKSHLCSLIYQKTFTCMKCFSVVILKFIWELKMSKVVLWSRNLDLSNELLKVELPL